MMNSKDGSSALTLAEEDLAAAVSELLMLAEPYDAFDVLELIYLRNTATANPGSYGETGYEGNALKGASPQPDEACWGLADVS
jgi:hypothetical protein